MTNHLATENARLRAALPEVIDADERISQAMLDNTSCQVEDAGGGLLSARTMVLCAYNDLRIVLGFVDQVRAALTPQDHGAGKDVGERARELLAEAYEAAGEPSSALAVRNYRGEFVGLYDVPLRAIEAALASAPMPVADDGLVERLRARFTPKPIPQCHICGADMEIGSMGPDGIKMYCSDKSKDTNHYFASLHCHDPGNEDVIALLDRIESLSRNAGVGLREAEEIISAWAFAHNVDGAARNDLFKRLRAALQPEERG